MLLEGDAPLLPQPWMLELVSLPSPHQGNHTSCRRARGTKFFTTSPLPNLKALAGLSLDLANAQRSSRHDVSPSLGDTTFACLVWGKTNTSALGTSPCPAGDILALAEGVLVRGRATCFTENGMGGGRSGTVKHPPPISTAEPCLCGIHPTPVWWFGKGNPVKILPEKTLFLLRQGFLLLLLQVPHHTSPLWDSPGKGEKQQREAEPLSWEPSRSPWCLPVAVSLFPHGAGAGFPSGLPASRFGSLKGCRGWASPAGGGTRDFGASSVGGKSGESPSRFRLLLVHPWGQLRQPDITPALSPPKLLPAGCLGAGAYPSCRVPKCPFQPNAMAPSWKRPRLLPG